MPLPRLFALHAIGLTTQKLKTSHAFHSPLMDAMLADFARVARQIAYAPPRLDIVSNLTGEFISDEIASPEYWCRHVRQPVKFMTGMETLRQRDYNTFVEIGPNRLRKKSRFWKNGHETGSQREPWSN